MGSWNCIGATYDSIVPAGGGVVPEIIIFKLGVIFVVDESVLNCIATYSPTTALALSSDGVTAFIRLLVFKFMSVVSNWISAKFEYMRPLACGAKCSVSQMG